MNTPPKPGQQPEPSVPPDERTVVQRGTWLYDGAIDTEVRICRSWVIPGTADYEDDPDTAEDRSAPCFYVWWGSPADPGRFESGVGPFFSVGDARAHVESLVGSSLRWDGDPPFFCPRCGDVTRLRDNAWHCDSGQMELSKQMATDLRECFVERTRDPIGTKFTFRVGGEWFCPGCGAPAIEADGWVECSTCHRRLNEFVHRLVELHPHQVVDR
jgi:hypothetical protein